MKSKLSIFFDVPPEKQDENPCFSVNHLKHLPLSPPLRSENPPLLLEEKGPGVEVPCAGSTAT